MECACIPTALLSTHTGEFTGWTRRDLTDQMLPIARHWASLGLEFDGIYSGYLASPEQALILEEVIGTIAGPETLVICDPAMADNGEYYAGFDDGMTQAFRRLCARADVITPNVTEAALLSGVEYRAAPHSKGYISRLFTGLEKHAGRYVAITGVHPADGVIGTVVRDRATGEERSAMSKAYPGMFYGTGRHLRLGHGRAAGARGRHRRCARGRKRARARKHRADLPAQHAASLRRRTLRARCPITSGAWGEIFGA